MKNQKIAHKPIRQNGEVEKKPHKHDTNLQKNSTLYFQVGLIVCLLAAYGLLEMKFETANVEIAALPPIDTIYSADPPNFTPEIIEESKPIEKAVTAPSETFIEVPDETPDIFIEETPKKEKVSAPITSPGDIILEEKPREPENVSFILIEDAPIYPGCEKFKDNKGRKKCMSDKITKLIQRKFDGNDIATSYGLQGVQRIDVQFTIDKTGKVNDIKTRSPHPKLDEEAERVIDMIPQMTPGKQRDKNVGVIYNLPIIFKAQ